MLSLNKQVSYFAHRGGLAPQEHKDGAPAQIPDSRRRSQPSFLTLPCIALAAFCLSLIIAPPARAQADSVPSVAAFADTLKSQGETDSVLRVIVQVDPSSVGGRLDGSNAGVFVHGTIRSVAPEGGFVAADVTPDEALALASRPGVRHVSFDWPVTPTGNSTSFLNPANFPSIGYNTARAYAGQVWQSGDEGAGIGIAVIDSGIQPHLDLYNGTQSRIIGWVDLVNGQSRPYDDRGHGTHVAGIIAGDGLVSILYNTQFPGVAPQANLIGVKVLDSTGSGSTSTVIAGIDWCIQHAAQYNIRVINLSLGHPVYESYTVDPLNEEVEKAWQAGIVVVVAAGNDGRLNAAPVAGLPNQGYGTSYGSIECPGNDPDVITVGAMEATDSSRSDDTIATYSSRGPTLGDNLLKPDIVAYGNNVISLYDPNGSIEAGYPELDVSPSTYGAWGPSEYFTLSGTSMSTPVVSGAAALMLAANPSLSPDTVKLRLMLSADKWGSDPFTYGAGYLDIPAAMASSALASRPMSSPVVNLGSNGLVTVANNAESILWGTSVLWGSGVTSSGAVASSAEVASDSILWGGETDITSADSIIWGTDTTDIGETGEDSAVWGSGTTTTGGGKENPSPCPR